MQVIDASGNMFGYDFLEVTGINGKPKVPPINTNITIGTTVIAGGVSGRLLFDDAGVVGETNGAFWDKVNSRFAIGITNPQGTMHIATASGTPAIVMSDVSSVGAIPIFQFRRQATSVFSLQIDFPSNNRARFSIGDAVAGYELTGGNVGLTGGRSIEFGGITGQVATGIIGSIQTDNNNGQLTFSTRGGGTTAERMRIFNDGNIGINTTTNAGFKTDINGTARVQSALDLGSAGTSGKINFRRSGDGTIVSDITQTNDVLNIHNAQGSGINLRTDNVTYLHVRGYAFQYAARVMGNLTAVSGLSTALLVNNAISASANNDILVGLDIAPTFNTGAFTNTSRIGVRIQNSRLLITGTYTSLSSELINPDSLMQIDATINGRGGSRAIAFRINPTINVNNAASQVFAALEVNPTYINVGVGSSALAINSIGPNVFGTINTFGAQTTFLGQGGTSTYHYVGTIPNGQGFRVQVNSNIAGYSFEFNGSGIPTFTLRNNNINAIQVYSTGNTGVNTSVDGGFKFDVNGTARVATRIDAGTFTAGAGASAYTIATTGRISAGNGISFRTPTVGDSIFVGFSPVGTGQIEAYAQNTRVFVLGGPGGDLGGMATATPNFNPSFGTGDKVIFGVNGTYNTTGTFTGTIRGFYYNPLLLSMTGVTAHYAFHSTSGRIRFENLPTSPAGLSSGELYNNLGVLMIV